MIYYFEHIVDIVCKVGKISGIGPDEDFYEAGFSSISALELLLELETAYVVSIPDDWFIAARSIRSETARSSWRTRN